MKTDNIGGRSHYNPFVEGWKRKNNRIADRLSRNDKNKAFQITSVCRADLEGIGIDSTKFDDATMEELASKMSDAYMENFWTDLQIIGDNLNK